MSQSTIVVDLVAALLRALDRQDSLLSFARSLSLFPASFGLDAALAVSGNPNTVDLCLQLRQMGAMIREESALVCYALNSDLRDYLAAHLTREEHAQLHARHVTFYCDLARDCGSHLGRIPDLDALATLDREHANLTQALKWARGQEAITAALALCPWYLERGHNAEGRKTLLRALKFHGDLSPLQRMNLWRGVGMCGLRLGDYPHAQRSFDIAMKLTCCLDDAAMEAQLHFDIATIAYDCKEFPAARQGFRRALERWRELGDRWGQACAIMDLGVVAQAEEKFAVAHSHYKESAKIFSEAGDKRRQTRALNNVATLAYYQGDYATAEARYRECLTIFQRLGDSHSVCRTLFNIGSVLCDQQIWEEAKLYLCKCLECICENGYAWHTGLVIANFAYIACRQNQPKRALRLFGAAHHLEAKDAPHSILDEAAFVQIEADVRAKVSAKSATQYTNQGWRMTLSDVLAEVAR